MNLAEKRLLIYPVHQKADSHWCLAVADVPAKQLTCFDSLEKENSDCSCLVLLKNYLFKLNGQCYSIAEKKVFQGSQILTTVVFSLARMLDS